LSGLGSQLGGHKQIPSLQDGGGYRSNDDLRGGENLNSVVAGKVALVVRQNPVNSVQVHGGNEFCVVHLHPKHPMGDHRISPLPVEPCGFRQDADEALHQ
jgi:hypothetical protein